MERFQECFAFVLIGAGVVLVLIGLVGLAIRAAARHAIGKGLNL